MVALSGRTAVYVMPRTTYVCLTIWQDRLYPANSGLTVQQAHLSLRLHCAVRAFAQDSEHVKRTKMMLARVPQMLCAL